MLLDQLLAIGWGGDGARIKGLMRVTFILWIADEYQYYLVDTSQWRHPGVFVTRDFPAKRWVRDRGTQKCRWKGRRCREGNRIIDTSWDWAVRIYSFLVYKSADNNNQICFSSVEGKSIHLREPRNDTTSRTRWQSMLVPTITLDMVASHSAMFLIYSIPPIVPKLLQIFPLSTPSC